MQRLEDKVAVVAGGATGIGAETARRLAREGARVVVGDVNLRRAGETAKGIEDAGGSAIAVSFDLADEASVAALMQAAVDTFGGLDLLHNNGADLSNPPDVDSDAVGIDIDVWDHVLRVNLRGYLFCCRHAIPHMLRRCGGAIVCTSSEGGSLGMPHLVAYSAAKAGVNALVRHVAARWGKEGVRCNAVSPGMILTDTLLAASTPEFVEAKVASVSSPRLGEPADIAGAVAYLLSDDAAWVNGQIISVNGGRVTR